MPPLLPWKKSKIGRVSSRFVSDLRSSTKHGGSSLVVETGFPTSLIDLIAKNRDRLKKPSKKNKKKNNKISDNFPPPPPPPRSPSLPLPTASSLGSIRFVDSSASSEIENPSQNNNVEEENENPRLDGNYKKTQVEIEEEKDRIVEIFSSGSNSKRILSLGLKVFFVLILAVGTRKLAIAITVLAFSLLFIELTGKNLFHFLKPCTNAKNMLNSAVGSFVDDEQDEDEDEVEVEVEDEDEMIIEQEETEKVIEKSYLIEEQDATATTTTTIVSSNVNSIEENVAKRIVDEIQIIEPGYDSLHCGCRWGFADKSSKRSVSTKVKDLIENDLRNSKKINSNARFNSKILKKFVPLRFKKKRKKKVGNLDSSCSELELSASNDGQDGNLEENEDEQECNEQEEGQEQEVDDNDDNDEDGETEEQSLDYVSQIETLSDVGESEGKVAERRKSAKHLVPMVVVLAGLMGGRVIALALTLVCCLLVKFMRNRKEGAYR